MKPETTAILALVALVMTANGLMGTALPVRMATLDISPALIAGLSAFAFGGTIIGAPISALAIGRLGNRGAYSAFASLFALWVLGMLLVSDALLFQLLRMATGIVLSALTVIVESRLNAIAPTGGRSRLLARYMVTFYATQAIGAALTGFDTTGGKVALGLAGLLLVLAAIFGAARGLPGRYSGGTLVFPRLYHLRRSPEGYTMGLLTGAMLSCFYGFSPVFAMNRLSNQALVGVFMAAAMIGGMAGLLISGRLADRFGLSRVSTVWAMLLVLAGIAMVELPPVSDLTLIGANFVFGTLLMSIYPFGSTVVNAQVAGEERVPANALYIIMIGVGGILGPIVGVHMVSLYGNRAGFAVVAACALAVVLVITGRSLFRSQGSEPTQGKMQR
jgi:MFS family permease